MKIIKLTKNFTAKIDDEDLKRISKYKWHASKKGKGHFYAMRSKRIDGSKIGIYLHREIILAKPGEEVDHIDGDVFNNQKSNLRLCTHSQNLANKRVYNRKKSRFRGIYKVGNKWAVKCANKYRGIFNTDIEAAKVFDSSAIKAFGEFASLNFPKGSRA